MIHLYKYLERDKGFSSIKTDSKQSLSIRLKSGYRRLNDKLSHTNNATAPSLPQGRCLSTLLKLGIRNTDSLFGVVQVSVIAIILNVKAQVLFLNQY